MEVYENVTVDSIVKYLQASKEKHIKLLSTPESFSKIKAAFEEIDRDIYSTCYLLFDECHKIVKDVDYRDIIRKSKFPQNPKRSVRFSGKRTKRSVQKRKARNTQKAETKVL